MVYRNDFRMGFKLLKLMLPFFFTACVTPRYQEHSRDMSGSASMASNEEDLAEIISLQKQNRYLAFVHRYSQSDAPLQALDQEAYENLVPSELKEESLEEAVVALGIIREFIEYAVAGKNKFNELDLNADSLAGRKPQQVDDTSLSLEKFVNDREFNLVNSLRVNPYLNTVSFYKLLMEAYAKSSYQSEDFEAAIRESVVKNFNSWEELRNKIDRESMNQDQSGLSEDSTDSELSSSDDQEKIAPALPFGEAVFAKDEDILLEAQLLAEQSKFLEAVELLASLPENSLFKAAAAEKLKEISNLAVHDLRRKAAKAFQSAKPLTDNLVKADFLKEAKNYLEQALELYPQAEQLHTVRQNLEVISGNLKYIENLNSN